MKKVLLATTALVATAGIASAQDVDTGVIITGFAEIGVFDPGNDDSDTLQFHTDIDVTFTMTGTTDSGLTFGADIDLDESDTDQTVPGVAVNRSGDDVGGGNVENIDTDGNGIISGGELDAFLDGGVNTTSDIEVGGSPAFDNSTQGGEAIFLTGPFGTVTMGDTDGGFDWALQEAIIGSAINDDHEHDGYNGNAGYDGAYDGQIVRYEYAFGSFAAAVSAEIDDSGASDPVLGVGARYSTSFGSFRGNPIGIGFGIGYQRIDSFEDIADEIGDALDDEDDNIDQADIYGISADLDLGGGLQAILNYADADATSEDPSYKHYGIAVGYTVDALTVAANYGRFSRDDVDLTDDDGGVIGSRDNDLDGYGVIVNYDLGGGAEAQFGYGHSGFTNDDGSDGNRDQYSLGIAMSF